MVAAALASRRSSLIHSSKWRDWFPSLIHVETQTRWIVSSHNNDAWP